MLRCDVLRWVLAQLLSAPGDKTRGQYVLLLRLVCNEWRRVLSTVGCSGSPIVFRLKYCCLSRCVDDCNVGLNFLSHMHVTLTVPSLDQSLLSKFRVAAMGYRPEKYVAGWAHRQSTVSVLSDEWNHVGRSLQYKQKQIEMKCDLETSAYSVIAREVKEMYNSEELPSVWACVTELSKWRTVKGPVDANLPLLLQRRFAHSSVEEVYRVKIMCSLNSMLLPSSVLQSEWVPMFVIDCIYDVNPRINTGICRSIQRILEYRQLSLPEEVLVRMCDLVWDMDSHDRLILVVAFGMLCRQRGSLPHMRYDMLMQYLASELQKFSSNCHVYGFLIEQLLQLQPSLAEMCSNLMVRFFCERGVQSENCLKALRLVICHSNIACLDWVCRDFILKLMYKVQCLKQGVKFFPDVVRVIMAFSCLSDSAFECVVSKDTFFEVLSSCTESFYDGVSERALARFATRSDKTNIRQIAFQCLCHNVGNTDLVASELFVTEKGFRSIEMLSEIMGLVHVIQCPDGYWSGLLECIDEKGALVLMGYMVSALGCIPYPIFERLLLCGSAVRMCLLCIGEVTTPGIQQYVTDFSEARFLYLLVFGSAAARNLAVSMDFSVLNAMEAYACKGFENQLLSVRGELEAMGVDAMWLLAQICANVDVP